MAREIEKRRGTQGVGVAHTMGWMSGKANQSGFSRVESGVAADWGMSVCSA